MLKNTKILVLLAMAIVVALLGLIVWMLLNRASGYEANERVMGTVVAVTKDQIHLQAADGTAVVVTVSQDTELARGGGILRAFDIADVEMGAWVVVVRGTRLKDGTVHATRIVVH